MSFRFISVASVRMVDRLRSSPKFMPLVRSASAACPPPVVTMKSRMRSWLHTPRQIRYTSSGLSIFNASTTMPSFSCFFLDRIDATVDDMPDMPDEPPDAVLSILVVAVVVVCAIVGGAGPGADAGAVADGAVPGWSLLSLITGVLSSRGSMLRFSSGSDDGSSPFCSTSCRRPTSTAAAVVVVGGSGTTCSVSAGDDISLFKSSTDAANQDVFVCFCALLLQVSKRLGTTGNG